MGRFTVYYDPFPISIVVELHMETDLMPMQDAIAFIGQCKLDGLRILGVDRYYARDGKVQPDLGGIADFTMSGRLGSPGDADVACAFICSIATDDSLFTVTFE